MKPIQLRKFMELGEAKGFGVFPRKGDSMPLCWRVPVLNGARKVDENGNLSWGGLHQIRVAAPVENEPTRQISGFWIDSTNSEVIRASDLPTEFFNHQLLMRETQNERETPMNPYNTNHLIDFVAAWGFPFAPVRDAVAPMMLSLEEGSRKEQDFLKILDDYGIGETEALATAMKEREPIRACIISEREASFAIGQLQQLVLEMHSSVKEGAPLPKIARLIIPFSSANPVQINENSGFDTSRDSLTNAIVNQIVNALADEETPWRECLCEGCNIVFKNKQSAARTTDNDSYYCCDRHMERQKQRNKRKAKLKERNAD